MFSKSNPNNALQSAYAILAKSSFVPGDIILLDLDQTLLWCKKGEKYTQAPMLTHPKLPQLLQSLQNQGVICVGLTARNAQYRKQTQHQLTTLGLSFTLVTKLLAATHFDVQDFSYADGVFYAPEQHIRSTKGIAAASLLHTLKTLDAFTLEQQGLSHKTLARHVFALDDESRNLEAIQQSLCDLKNTLTIEAVETHSVSYAPIFVSNAANATPFPADLSALEFIEHLDGGSGGVYRVQERTTGRQYTFKAHSDVNHLHEELISDALYQAAGCAVPDFAIITAIPACLEDYDIPRNGVYRLAQFICAAKKQDKIFMHKELARHFLVDALLANWDIAVGDFKNVILDQNNRLYRIDNGGALRYRATQGLKQEGSSWSAYYMSELETLRDSSRNKDAAAVYQGLTQEDLKQQHEALLPQVNSLFTTLSHLAQVLNIEHVEELQQLLAARLYDLEIRLHKTPHPYAKAFTSLKANKERSSASILVLSEVQGIPCALLGQRIRHQWYGDLGGKSEIEDGTLMVTAARECAEETGGKIQYSPAQLEQYPSHDLITQHEQKGHTHRMFLAQKSYIPSHDIADAVQKETTQAQEYTDFQWVPVAALLTALHDRNYIHEEHQETLQVDYTSPETGDKHRISLFPPLAKMLQQAPVTNHLQHLMTKNDALVSFPHRTRSHANAYAALSQNSPPRYQNPILLEPQQPHIPAIKVRTVFYGNQSVEERVYPDPAAEQHCVLKNTVRSSVLLNQEIKNKAKENTTPPTSPYPSQSIAHLQGLLETNERSAAHLVPQFFAEKMRSSPMATDVQYQEKLIQIIEAEANHPNHIVLYHATNAHIGFFYDLISKVRSTLVCADIRSLRTFDDVFAGLNDVEAFLQEQCRKQNVSRQELNNYSADYQEKGLSCNFSVFANYNHPTSSSFEYFYTNSTATNNDKKVLVSAFNMLLRYLNIQSVRIQEFIDVYEQHQKDLGAHLYQIFIAQEHVDTLCYFSSFHGRYHNFLQPWQEGMSPEDQHKLAPVITALRQDPQAFAKNQELKRQDSLQVRLFMQPYLMHDPHIVQVSTYKMQKKPKLAQQELAEFAQRIVQELLYKKQGLQVSYQASIQGNTEQTALQRKYAYVVQGEIQQSIRYNRSFNIHLLYQCITSNDTVVFERLLNSLPEGFDLGQELNDFSGRIKEPLLFYALKEQQINMVSLLVNNKCCTSKLLSQKDNQGNTLLTLATRRGATEIAIALLESKYCTAELVTSTPYHNKITTLIEAVRRGNIDLVKALLNSRYCSSKFVAHTNSDEKNALIIAVEKGHARIVKALLESPYCSPEYVAYANSNNVNALLLAISLGHTEIAKSLLESKYCTAELVTSTPYHNKTTTLLEAVNLGNIDLVKTLLNRPFCSPEFLAYENSDNINALVVAISLGHTEIAKALLESKYCTAELVTSASGYYKTTTLIEAVRRGNIDLVKALLNSRYCSSKFVAHTNSDEKNALIIAVEKGHARIVKALLESPYCSPEYVAYANSNNVNALLLAISLGHAEIAKALLESKYCTAELVTSVSGYYKTTTLIEAVRCGNIDLVKTLLNSGYCSPEFVAFENSDNTNALFVAISLRHTEIAKALLESKYCTAELVFASGYYKTTTLIEAVRRGNIDLVKALLNSRYCSPEFVAHTNSDEKNALLLAIIEGHTEIAISLLESKYCTAELVTSTPYHNKTTTLLKAVNLGNIDLVKTLLNSPFCSPEFVAYANEEGNNALIEAAQRGYTDIMKLLLESIYCIAELVAHTNKNGDTALHWVVKKAIKPIIKILLENKHCTSTLVTHANSNGETALHWTAEKGRKEIGDALLNSEHCTQEFVTHINNNGDTALILLASNGRAKVLKAVLDNKYCSPEFVNHANHKGDNALIVAVSNNHRKTLNTLLSHKHCSKKLVTHVNNDGNTALIIAAKVGRIELVKLLLNSNYCSAQFVTHANNQGETALSWAKRKDLTEIVTILEKYNVVEKTSSVIESQNVRFFNRSLQNESSNTMMINQEYSALTGFVQNSKNTYG
ncbi:ankyrin repeat domain-containing protein [Legionella longbeachae]|uniref:Ankyrin repeat protein and nudix protein interaction domain n=1 Tax=Legionella longbeachae serogroup 1 (strain NSW150) TaxID=661367 RepID=D3HMW6_LEGLN|nr:ankyrin repeat domain-containing protein [Legionella longbeachae]VEE04331.1 ankyrin [Legionella oakridgensis]ARB92845.1 DUF2608 domain-containing protein [Legionella longbeachae]QIN37231.1 DUF2608 domain-containing protein [Legionella longbeachae]RZV26495.1 DUF2608 domain-containing protein [Legionella longbeachae]UAK47266.1 ankyrin repeat domain-containing protein [Legionella longbeachae]